MAAEDFEKAVRERAYFIWEEEGRQSGYDLDHWVRAQSECKEGGIPPEPPATENEVKELELRTRLAEARTKKLKLKLESGKVRMN